MEIGTDIVRIYCTSLVKTFDILFERFGQREKHILGMNGCASIDSSFLFILRSAFWTRNKDTA